ncbi:hypothetical protein PQR62_06895 [Herbaspirillum lusitanum]|uniref:Uncharacterized protein n=1 Tax=Herbaspirillum lusitanum TaxID=213312 RepID=A0ABW9A7P1_9BURK
MALYFKNKARKTFMGAPVGWPLMFGAALALAVALLMFLSDHPVSACVLLYPPTALFVAMYVDSRRERLSGSKKTSERKARV